MIVNEIEKGVSRVGWCDSQAAVSILANEGGSWRTRHLRVRASFARSAIKRGSWLLHHVAGTHMVADIGTKVLTSVRMEFLKKLLGMRCCFPEVKDQEISTESPIDQNLVLQAVRVLTIAALLDVAEAANHTNATNGSEEGEKIEPDDDFRWLFYLYTLTVVVLTSLVIRCFGWLEPQIHRGFDLVMIFFGRRDVFSQELSHPEGRGSRGAHNHDPKVCLHDDSHHFKNPVDDEFPKGPQRPIDLPPQEDQTPRVARKAPISGFTPISTSPLRPFTQAEASSSSMSINIGGIQLELGETATPFRPLVTRHGSVYHTDENCKYLKSKFTGKSYRAEFCDHCAAVILKEGRVFPQRGDVLKGDPVSFTAGGTLKFHVENGCNFRGPFNFLTHCVVCSKKD